MLQVCDTTHSWVVAPPSETAFVFFFLLQTCDVQQSIGATLNMRYFWQPQEFLASSLAVRLPPGKKGTLV